MESIAAGRVVPLNVVSPTPPRTLPFNTEAEQALLGALLISNRAYSKVSDCLSQHHFGLACHGRIFEAIGKAIDRGEVANPVTLKPLFAQDEALASIGGGDYLMRLAACVVTIVNAEEYGRHIYDLYLRRQLIAIGEDIVNEAYKQDLDDPAPQQIERAERKLYEVAEASKDSDDRSRWIPIGVAVDRAIATIEKVYQANGALTGLSTGLIDLDRRLGGLQASDLVVIAGRPSMGKAQPLDARVLLADGSWKTMGSLRLGDTVASVDGEPSVVTGIFPRGHREVFKITMSDGRSTRACADHLWSVNYRDWDCPRTVTTNRLAEMLSAARYKRRLWLPQFSGVSGHSKELPIDPWVLGAMLGDGCMKGQLSFSTDSAFVLQKLRAAVSPAMDVVEDGAQNFRIVVKARRDCFQCGEVFLAARAGQRFCSHECRVGYSEDRQRGIYKRKENYPPVPRRGLRPAIKRLGLWGLGSHEKFVPDMYKSADKEARTAVLCGLLDTDGSVEKFGCARFWTTSERLADDVIYLVRSLGGWASKCNKQTHYPSRGERCAGLPSFAITIDHPESERFFSIPEKRERLTARSRRARSTFESVVADGEEETQCITVSHPSQLYVTDDFIVTHNTALAFNIGSSVARSGRPVLGFSLEMSAEQIAMREIAKQTDISTDLQRGGPLTSQQMDAVIAARNDIAALPMVIDDGMSTTVAQIRSRARRFKRQHGLSLIIVDYLQLLASETRNHNDNRVQEVSAITRGLKGLAKELQVPVIAVSQLSRAVEAREDKRPNLADLRESGSIEQDADVVMFVYREEYYLSRNGSPTERQGENQEHYEKRCADYQTHLDRVRGIAEILIPKQRMGRIGAVRVHFDGTRTAFENLARQWQ